MVRAMKISDSAWRERFLRGVPDNARTLELAGTLPVAVTMPVPAG